MRQWLLRGATLFVLAASLSNPTLFSWVFTQTGYSPRWGPAILILLFGVLCLKQNRGLPEDWKRYLPLAVFALVTVLSTCLQIQDLRLSQYLSLFSISGVVLCFAYLLPPIFAEEDFEWVLRGLVVLVGFYSVLCLYAIVTKAQFLLGYKLFFNGYTKDNYFTYGIYTNRNQAAHFTLWVPAVCVALYQSAKRSRGIWAGVGAATFLHVLLTFSRGSILGLLASLIPIFYLLYQKNRKLFFSTVALGMVGLVLLITFHDFARQKFLLKIMEKGNRDSYWMDSFAFLSQGVNWVWGSGLWGYWPGSVQPDQRVVTSLPHNSFFTYLLYFGVLGFVSYLLIFYDRLRHLLEGGVKGLLALPLSTQAIFFSAVGLSVTAQVADILARPLYFPGLIFWFLVGFLKEKP
jgi:hypothetical protein